MKSKFAPLPKSDAKTAYGLLSAVRRIILAEPRRYNQCGVLVRHATLESVGFRPPACGTIGCVGGWVAVLKQPDCTGYNALGNAKRILDLTSEQANELFDGDATGYTGPQTASHARRGAAHIRRFQQKYEKQLKATRV